MGALRRVLPKAVATANHIHPRKCFVPSSIRALSTSVPEYDVKKLYDHNYLDLPRLPLPKIEDTLKAYLRSVKPLVNDEQFAKTEKLAEKFATTDAPKLQAELKKLTSGGGYPYSYIEKFWDDMYLGGRWPLMIHVNPFYVLNDEINPAEQEQLRRAAKFATSSIRWWLKVVNGKLEPDRERDGTPLCMYQFGGVFGTGRIPKPDRDALKYHPFSKHIVVICNNQYFRVDVIDESGKKAISSAALEKKLNNIKKTASSNPVASKERDVGLLTAVKRPHYAAARSEMEQFHPENKLNFATMDEALFILVLEDLASPNMNERSRMALHGDGSNRWFDKHQIIVGADGCLTINFEHSNQDGLTWNRWMQEAWHDMKGTKSGFSPLLRDEPGVDFGSVKPINWKLSDNSSAAIQTAARLARDEINNVDLEVLNFTDFGRNRIKDWKVSPDAASQMAMQIAYMKVHGKPAATYEACAMKNYFHGRTETIRSCTIEAVEMSKAFIKREDKESKKQKFLKAAATHIEVAKGAKTCSGPFQGVDRHLYAMKCIAAERGWDVEFYKDPTYGLSTTWVLSTSNVSTPFYDLFGFGAVCEHGYGFGYQTSADSLPFCITSFKSNGETSSSKMSAAIAEALHEIDALF